MTRRTRGAPCRRGCSLRRLQPALVLYDLDCGFCRWALSAVLAWDRHRRLRPVAIQDAEGQHLLRDLDPEARLASWHLVLPDGRRSSAGPAVVDVCGLLPGGKPLSRVLAGLHPVADRIYAAVARNRGRVGRRLPHGSVERATERIAERSAAESLIHPGRVASGGLASATRC